MDFLALRCAALCCACDVMKCNVRAHLSEDRLEYAAEADGLSCGEFELGDVREDVAARDRVVLDQQVEQRDGLRGLGVGVG